MKYLLNFIMCLVIFSCSSQKSNTQQEKLLKIDSSQKSLKIAFGSCSEEDKPQPLLDVAVALNPDLFIYLGDNIYGDTYSMDTLKMKYQMLANKPEFKRLKSSTPILSVWDDHDYGWNDAGRHYPYKEESKEIFMNFWNVPQNSERRKHKGIYGSEFLNFKDLKIQIILLDTRTFRDDLLLNDKKNPMFKNDYMPNPVKDSTFLGEQQWNWLDKELSKDADVRIIASSNQFSHEYNGWESWTNVPHEQQRFINLIEKNKANGVIFISGDVHWGEISKMTTDKTYPLYDVTSSGITEMWYNTEPNKNRVGDVIPQNNIGLIEITENNDKVELTLSLYDATNKSVVKHSVNLKEIQF